MPCRRRACTRYSAAPRTQAIGQGLETTYAQLIAEVLQIPARAVTIVQGDTDRVNGVGSVGSRSAFVGGSAVVAAQRYKVYPRVAIDNNWRGEVALVMVELELRAVFRLDS